MGSTSNIVALNRFAHAISLDKLRTGIKTLVTVVIDGEVKYETLTELYYKTANEYGNPEITIYWELPDRIRKDLGLYGAYSSVFNEYHYDNEKQELVIKTDDSIIYISSKNQKSS